MGDDNIPLVIAVCRRGRGIVATGTVLTPELYTGLVGDCLGSLTAVYEGKRNNPGDEYEEYDPDLFHDSYK